MTTKTLTFRVPDGWASYFRFFARIHGFASRGEMLSLVLTGVCHRTVTSILFTVGGKVEGKTEVVGCRLGDNTYQLIKVVCCKRMKDTASVWAAVALYTWWEKLERQEDKERRKARFPIDRHSFAEDYRL